MTRVFTMDDVPILYEDNHLLVVCKPQNIPTQADKTGDLDLLTMLKQYIKERDKKTGNVYLGLVHRLDRVTGGVMVFAKTSKAAARLCEQISTSQTEKRYLTVLLGKRPNQDKGQLVNYLKKNVLTNTVYVSTVGTEGAKKAVLDYQVLDVLEDLVLVKVQLETGRSHQIRVQFAANGSPVWGDVRYGGDKYSHKGDNIALWAYELIFAHPTLDKRMVFVAYPPEQYPWTLFNVESFCNHFTDSDY